MAHLPLLLGSAALALAAVCVLLALLGGSAAPAAGVSHIESFYAHPEAGAAAPEPAVKELSSLLELCRKLAMRISPKKGLVKIQHNLDLAGNPAGWRAERVLAYKVVASLGTAGFAFLIGLPHGAAVLLFVLGGAGIGYLLPNMLLYNYAVKRQEQLQKQLPDAMDMMTVCVEAGLGFDAALTQVARNTTGPLASDFARVLQEMQFGLSRSAALKALASRTTVAELRTMVSALVQAAELGIPVAAVLREQASEMRMRRRQRAEEKAQKVTVKILFPLIFCLLPALFIVVMGPGVIGLMASFSGV